jgi:hypothetical protein
MDVATPTRKLTPVYQLGPYAKEVIMALDPKEKKWFPMSSYTYDGKQCFIYGRGYVKTGKWKKETVAPLAEMTAEALKIVADQYGVNAAMGMVASRGYDSLFHDPDSLFHDQSCGLFRAKCEVRNMVRYGKQYDQFTDMVQEIGDKFIDGLVANGWTYINNKALWWDYEGTYPRLASSDKFGIHPAEHIEHCIIYPFGSKPTFNALTLDDMVSYLITLRYSKDGDYSECDRIREQYVSTKDRIAHLTGKTSIAERFEEIFMGVKMFAS